jgi:hypothetical protein
MSQDQSKYTPKKKYNDPLDELLQRPIAYHPSFARMLGSTAAAVMLSQGLYWQARVKSIDGYWWKTADEWEEETGLSRNEQEDARRKLRQTTFWFEELRGVPATMYYLVDKDSLIAELSGEQHKEMTIDEIIENSGIVLARLAKSALMRARKMGVEAIYVDYSMVLRRDQAICGVCQKPITRGPGKFGDALHFDHVLPLSREGKHVPENVTCTHADCNLHKGNQISYAKESGMITQSEQVDLMQNQQDELTQAQQDGLPKENINKESEITPEITPEITHLTSISLSQIWEQVLEQLKPGTPRAAFQTYIEPTRAIRYGRNVLEIAAPNADAQAWLEDRIQISAERLLIGILNKEVRVSFLVAQELPA